MVMTKRIHTGIFQHSPIHKCRNPFLIMLSISCRKAVVDVRYYLLMEVSTLPQVFHADSTRNTRICMESAQNGMTP